jgi:LuxR family maltose regulon positive regulatory protein
MGQHDLAERAIAELDQATRDSFWIRFATALLHLARDEPQAAVDLLAPLVNTVESMKGSPVETLEPPEHVLVLDATAKGALGDLEGAEESLGRAWISERQPTTSIRSSVLEGRTSAHTPPG